MNLDILKTASLLTVTSVYTQLYPYYYSVCACPVRSCLYTYCVQHVVWSPGSCAYCSQKRKKEKKKTQ